uniref:Uncharacterized protein n=1 Tax=Ciona savignyi TaxID=51511 RepID=H2Z193_CIOSA
MRTLTALLHTKNPRTVREAITAILYVVSDSDENKLAVVADHGLEDLAFSCKYADHRNRKMLSTIFLELAYYSETRSPLLTRSTPAAAIVALLIRSSSTNDDFIDENLQTTMLALQTLELLAIDTPSLITGQENLLEYLLALPSRINDKKVQLLAAQLLVNWTHSLENCERLCYTPGLTDNLLYFAHSNDPNLIKVIATLSLRLTEPIGLRSKLNDDDFQEFLGYLQNASNDRQTWNLAAQALDNLQNKPDSGFIQKKPVRSVSITSSDSEPMRQ